MGSIYKPTYRNSKGKLVTSRLYWIKYYRNGRTHREGTGTDSYKSAKKILQDREGDIAKGKIVIPGAARIRFEELSNDMINEYIVNGRKSLSTMKIRMRKHILPVFSHRVAISISTTDIRNFIVTRKKEGAANAEVNHELAVMKRAFNLAIQAEKINSKPYFPMLEEDNVRQGFFEAAEFELLCRYLPEELLPIARFAYITGWRIQSEILKMEWHQVDFSAEVVTLDVGTTKNREARTFPFTDQIRKLLQNQRLHTRKIENERAIMIPYVFHRNGNRIKDFRASWHKACKSAGLVGRIPHDLRRTAVRNMVRAGISEKVAMLLTGHKTREVFERYNIVSSADLVQAAKVLDQVMGKVLGKVEHFYGT